VLLSGEAGIAKSRLTVALLERLDTEPHTRLRYFCSPQHTDSALYPIIGQMERAAGLAHDDKPQARLDKLDAVLARTSTSTQDAALFSEMLSLPNDGRYPVLDLTPQQRRQRTLEAFTAQLAGLASRQPVLMIFEDVHWIDPTSLEAVGRAVDRIRTLPALLIVTFRPEFDAPWVGQSHVTSLTLNRLGEREAATIIARLVGNQGLPADVMAEIVERTDGIPLFVEEMTKAVLEAENEGAARRTVAAVPSPALAVPASARVAEQAGGARHGARWRRSAVCLLPVARQHRGRDAAHAVVQRLRQRFGIAQVCVVADRGMISVATIAALEKAGLEYILGVRERFTKEVRNEVIEDDGVAVPLVIPRQRGETQLAIKETTLKGRRYVLCRNEEEVRKDAERRGAILAGLDRKLTQGDKALVRRFVKAIASGNFSIDHDKVAADAKFDGLFVLRTNTKLSALQVVLRYRNLLAVEDAFKTAKALLTTRPIFHKTDAGIRGHVFCSFLAVLLRKELYDRLAARRHGDLEWQHIVDDLDELSEVEVEQDGRRARLRTAPGSTIDPICRALGITLPPVFQEIPPAPEPA